MVKTASAKAGGAVKKKAPSRRKAAKSDSAAPAKAAKPRKAAGGRAKAKAAPKQDRKAQQKPQHGAADVVIKLLESPLVVDLIAVGATAALAAIAENRFGRRDDDERASRSAAKAAGKAAAAAMGRRIANEVDEILKATKETKRGAKS